MQGRITPIERLSLAAAYATLALVFAGAAVLAFATHIHLIVWP